MKIKTSQILIVSILICLGFSPRLHAVNPPPDGGYPGGNTAEGQSALLSRTTGIYNTGIGIYSLLSLTGGNFCTGAGAGTLLANTADENTATGAGALFSNTSGSGNMANGAFALFSNTAGGSNTADGDRALLSNTSGNFNTAVGSIALLNSTGGGNTAIGYAALSAQTSGSDNTAIGSNALSFSTGNENTALGIFAGNFVTTASNVICIGTPGANVDNSCFIGNIYFNVQPIVGTDPDSVTIASSGRLGRGNVSSRRYKHDIQSMDKASEVLYALKPVSFRYNKEYDATQTLAFGLIAEEVADVYPDLVGRNNKGQPESVRYEQVNAMLLNEFLKEHRKVQKQQEEIEALKAELREQRDLIHKVSAKIEMGKTARRVAGIDQ